MVTKKKTANTKRDVTIAASAEMRALVEDSLEDIRRMERFADKAPNPEEAKLALQQAYFANLKAAGQPMALGQRLLAELLTRWEADRLINGDEAPLDDKFLKILEAVNKQIKLTKDLGPTQHVMTHKLNDRNFKVVDAEVMGELFPEEEGK